ncbi:phage tail assembly protein [Salipiger sp. IMCC34102]|uniref:phage tail assembly protein n=1 Tax=Salipiger sp. IMCC34102 TaxID=2510647 RepID=UPI00101BFA96|nr:phage tail assembly protein [Salipiger sp. IMCC34102]RYH02826.1 phage tail assembly protein [Salipiger sp. IMCC34102]
MTLHALNRVTLQDPIEIDGKPVAEIELRKPGTGELRGLKLTDLLQMDVDAMSKLIPRISQPYLGPAELARLDPADFAAICVVVTTFFAKRRQLEGTALTIPDAETA